MKGPQERHKSARLSGWGDPSVRGEKAMLRRSDVMRSLTYAILNVLNLLIVHILKLNVVYFYKEKHEG